jgi:acarbose 7IV-phosphotransferase
MVKVMKTVLVLGGVSYDSIIHLKQLPESKPMTIYANNSYDAIGSTGAGKALCFSQLGLDVTLHGLIGDDAYGNKIIEQFKKKKINFLFNFDPKGTERHVNLMDECGRRISIYTNSATFNPDINPEELTPIIEKSDGIVLNIINYCRHYIPIIKQANKEIWCDLHDYDGKNPYHQDFVDAADYLFMSSDCLEDYRSYMESLIVLNKELIVCTHGKEGVTALTKDGMWYDLPIIQDYQHVDANGAGDNFFAGFLYGYNKGYSILKCLQFGTITAGLCINSKELVNDRLSIALLEDEHQKYYQHI